MSHFTLRMGRSITSETHKKFMHIISKLWPLYLKNLNGRGAVRTSKFKSLGPTRLTGMVGDCHPVNWEGSEGDAGLSDKPLSQNW